MGKKIVAAALNYFSNTKLLGEVNRTIVTLIPKVPKLAIMTEFWHVSCCRLKSFLPDVISPAQCALVEEGIWGKHPFGQWVGQRIYKRRHKSNKYYGGRTMKAFDWPNAPHNNPATPHPKKKKKTGIFCWIFLPNGFYRKLTNWEQLF